MLKLANIALHIVHLLIVLFSLLGWLVPAWRAMHLLLCATIAFSWFVIGLSIGQPGYCLVTALQQRLWKRLKISDRGAYIPYLIKTVCGREIETHRSDLLIQLCFYSTTAISLSLFIFERNN